MLKYMDIIYIPTKYKIKEYRNLEKLKEILPKRFGLVSIKQYEDIAMDIIKILKNSGYDVIIKNGLYGINVLGCYSEPSDIDADTILLIGNGIFHALNIARKFGKKVIIYDPIYGEIKIIEDKAFRTKIYMLLEKLKRSTNIGIITSIKPGQYYIREMFKYKKILEEDGKRVYLFIGDIININDLKNFPFIEFWIILACPRIIDDILENDVNGLTIDLFSDLYAKIRQHTI